MPPNRKLLLGFVLLMFGLFALTACANAPKPTLTTSVAACTKTPVPTVAEAATQTPVPSVTIRASASPSITFAANFAPALMTEIDMVNLIEPQRSTQPIGVNYRKLSFTSSYLPYLTCGAPYYDVRQINFERRRRVTCYIASHFSPTQAGTDISILLTIPNPTELIDEKGGKLTPVSRTEPNAIVWKKSDGTLIAMPLWFPRFYGEYEVTPVMRWGGGMDQRVLTGWQVWLIANRNGSPVKQVENPFVTLEQDETIVVNPLTGYLEPAKLAGDAHASTGKQLGMQLAEPPKPVATVQEIPLYGEFTQGDATYLGDSLTLLCTRLPKWDEYVRGAKPFRVFLNPSIKERNALATASCCDFNVYGRIDFVDHFVRLPSGPLDTPEATRLNLMATLVHETTHVLDARARRIHGFGLEGCIAAERSAYTKELEFLRDSAQVRWSDLGDTEQNYHAAIDEEISDISERLQGSNLRKYVNPACGH